MWSFACILAELFTGYPIYPGENEQEQIGYMTELKGVPPPELLERGSRAKLFFDEEGRPIPVPNSRGKVRKPNAKTFRQVLGCNDKAFLDFLQCCFEWIPEKRITPEEALCHEWILEGLPAKMLLTVHDELVFEVAEDAVDKTVAAVREVMEGAADPAVKLSVPLTVDAGQGANWAEAH